MKCIELARKRCRIRSYKMGPIPAGRNEHYKTRGELDRYDHG